MVVNIGVLVLVLPILFKSILNNPVIYFVFIISMACAVMLFLEVDEAICGLGKLSSASASKVRV